MHYQELKSSILSQFSVPNGHKTVFYIDGAPGAGKSALSADIANTLAEQLGIPEERVVTFNPSLREPCDVLGLPSTAGEYTRWTPSHEFYRIRKGTGAAVLRIEELADADVGMQNVMCRIVLDRMAGELPLSEQLYIICTGNRVADKSGANRMTTKLADRMRILHFEEDFDDWADWADGAGIDPVLVGFLRFRPNLFSDFSPNRMENPTPRSWEDVSRIPLDLMSHSVATEHVAGSVGTGAACEYMAFRRIYKELPDFEEMMRDPKNFVISQSMDIQYAIATKLTTAIDATNIDKMWALIKRLSPELTSSIMMVVRKKPGIVATKAYTTWCLSVAKHVAAK